VIVLVAGGATFTTEWMYSKVIDWKVPLATVLLAAAMEGVSAVDRNGGTLLGIMIALGAFSTKFNGHSFFDMITGLAGATTKPATKTTPATSTTTPAA
jgi:hypothetical protein